MDFGIPIIILLQLTPQAFPTNSTIDSNNLTNTINNYTNNYNYSNNYNYNSYVCKNRKIFCNMEESKKLCAYRRLNETMEYKEFENSCYLFLSNTCDNRNKEFYIIGSGYCSDHSYRRQTPKDAELYTYETVEDNDTALMNPEYETSTLPKLWDDGELAYDDHPCPMYCTDEYNPICINVNRRKGKYFKLFYFVNHCHGDRYYCANNKEFWPPPDDEYLQIVDSPITWAFCGSANFVRFARFSESAATLAHSGWLQGDYKLSKILSPHQKKKLGTSMNLMKNRYGMNRVKGKG